VASSLHFELGVIMSTYVHWLVSVGENRVVAVEKLILGKRS
jgi:hypothetical protein